MTMEIVGNDAQFNGKVTLLKDLEIYGNIKNKTKDTSFDFSDNLSFKIQGNEKLRITPDGTTFTDTVTAPSGIFSDSITVPNVSAETVIATEYYGTFKGSIDPSVADDKISEGNSSAEVVDTGSNGHFKVLTEGTERFRILSDGDVGIGTTNPFGMLEVQKNGVPAIISNYNNSKHIQMDTGNDGAGFQLTTGNHFAINHQPYADRGTNNNLTERLRITSGGIVKITNSEPQVQLIDSDGTNQFTQIIQSSSAFYIDLRDNTNDGQLIIRGKGGDTATERLRIDSGGVVNIGVNASSNPFTYLRFGASQYGAADIRPTDESSHKVGLAFYTDGTQDTTINPTEKLRIASAGQIGIGGANYGTTGQVLTSQGSGSAVQWTSTAAKAFVNFDGTTNTGGNCTIRDSHNVSSVTDHSTGRYIVNFSTAFANTNYVTTVGHSNENNNGSTHGVLYLNTTTTGSVEVMNFADDSGGNLVDKVVVCVVVHAT